ncbi:MAG: hypothetical protein MUF27_11540 [Acidobacteria bacterium]|jgi:hypothetical protein|nr:hypothetical protein [Acidobacteriota bacterium]
MRAVIVAAGVLCCLWSPESQARGVVATPVQLGLVGQPGATVSDVILVASPREEQNSIRVALADFVKDEDGRARPPVPGDNLRSCSPWLTIDKTEFTTPERGRVELRVTARIPPDATGTYWAVVELQALPPPRGPERGMAVAIVPSVAVPVVVSVAGTENRVVSLAGPVEVSVLEGAVEASVLVENSGNAAVILTGAFALEQQAGNTGDAVEVASGDVSPVTSLPGSRLRVKAKVPWSGSLDGLSAHAYLRYGPGPAEGLTASLALAGLPAVPASPRSDPPAGVTPNAPGGLAPPAPTPPAKPAPPDGSPQR